MIEHFVIAFNPNGPKCSAPKEVPDFDIFTVFLGDPFPEHSLLLIEIIIIISPNPTKFMHDECGPSPRSLSLDAIPKFMFDWFARVREAKNTLFGDEGGCNACPPFIDCSSFVPNKPYESGFLAWMKQIPHLSLVEPVVTLWIALPLSAAHVCPGWLMIASLPSCGIDNESRAITPSPPV